MAFLPPNQHVKNYYYYNHFIALDFVWDNLGEPVPEGTFCHILDFRVQNEDNTGRCTSSPDGLSPHPE